MPSMGECLVENDRVYSGLKRSILRSRANDESWKDIVEDIEQERPNTGRRIG